MLCCVVRQRYRDGKLINERPEFKMKRLRIHLNHALEIKDVGPGDAGLYTAVLKNNAAALERRLNITLVVNGNCSPHRDMAMWLSLKAEVT